MRRTPHYLLEDPAEVKRLVREHPWATIVSHTAKGLVASHYPVLLDETSDEIVLLSHVGRPDERLHELGEHEVLVIVAGPHGYVSSSWYPDASDFVPTWNHVTAHLYGTPELLADDENLRVLGDLVDHFERHVDDPQSLDVDPVLSARIAKGTVGIRIRVTRFDARAKLSQNRPPETVARLIAEFEGDGPYAQAGLAVEMRRAHPDAVALLSQTER